MLNRRLFSNFFLIFKTIFIYLEKNELIQKYILIVLL